MADKNEINVHVKIEREQLSKDQQLRYDIVANNYLTWFHCANVMLGKLHLIPAFILDGMQLPIKWLIQFNTLADPCTDKPRVGVSVRSMFGAFGFEFKNLSDQEFKQIQDNVKFLQGKDELITKLYFSYRDRTNFFVSLKYPDMRLVEDPNNTEQFVNTPKLELDIKVVYAFLSDEQKKRYDIVYDDSRNWFDWVQYANERVAKPHLVPAFILDGILPHIKWTLVAFDYCTVNSSVYVRASSAFGDFGRDFKNLTNKEIMQIHANIEFLTGKHELINKLFFSYKESIKFFVALKDTDIQSAEEQQDVDRVVDIPHVELDIKVAQKQLLDEQHVDQVINLPRIELERKQLPEEQQLRYDIVAYNYSSWYHYARNSGKFHIIPAFVLDGTLPPIEWKLQFLEFINTQISARHVIIRINSDFGAFGFDFVNPSDQEVEQIQANVKFLNEKRELINKLYFSNKENTKFFVALRDTNVQSAEEQQNADK